MTPERVEELAQWIDPDELWRCAGAQKASFTQEQKNRYDAAVAIRRYGNQCKTVNDLVGTGQTLTVTPRTENMWVLGRLPSGVLNSKVKIPDDQRELTRKLLTKFASVCDDNVDDWAALRRWVHEQLTDPSKPAEQVVKSLT